MKPGRILQRAELAPADGETPGNQAMPRRRYILKAVTYRYPVEENITRIIRSLRDRIGAEDLREYLGDGPFFD
jgi:hypothetical protein